MVVLVWVGIYVFVLGVDIECDECVDVCWMCEYMLCVYVLDV